MRLVLEIGMSHGAFKASARGEYVELETWTSTKGYQEICALPGHWPHGEGGARQLVL